ncbi:calcium/sodium antiporter [Pseudokineococcus marinus]|uniref:Calcium/sodium antiporter n=1 Tax=Pseudokineococcus marinus TaxID=351215 RepID=A0A849C316_9ACTN|nr:calcium/sodium antiporter [Pseudokineococcus marinus]NNH24038.1 calcium/sodium antiporter [Pseudokineococcus marinus]
MVALVALLVLGVALLVAGGELLVRGGGGLARAAGLSPLVVGLTVVAAATSAPELAVTLGAALDGAPGLAVGNVVGSNIANVLLILGLSALVLPLLVGRQLLRVDIPVLLAVSALAWVLALDGDVGRLDGALLLVLLVAYVARSVVVSRRADAAGRAPAPDGTAPGGTAPGGTAPAGTGGGGRPEGTSATRAHGDLHARAAAPRPRVLRDALLVVAGVALLVGGAQALVGAASTIAADLGVSDLVVGLTVVAVGTSLPELATSVVAVVRGERDMAIGNVVGSGVFNLGAVLGLTALVSPGGVPVEESARTVDLPVMVGAAAVLLLLGALAADVSRLDGALLLLGYAAYTTHLVLGATGGTPPVALDRVLLVGGALALLLVVAVEVRRRRRAGSG